MKSKNRKRRKQRGDIAVTVRLPIATIKLIKLWQDTFGYETRSDVIRAMMGYGLHVVNAQMA